MPGPGGMKVDVECYAGHRGEETPWRFVCNGRPVEIEAVLDRWLAPDHRYFKLRGADGAVYILRHDSRAGFWEIVSFDRASPAR